MRRENLSDRGIELNDDALDGVSGGVTNPAALQPPEKPMPSIPSIPADPSRPMATPTPNPTFAPEARSDYRKEAQKHEGR